MQPRRKTHNVRTYVNTIGTSWYICSCGKKERFKTTHDCRRAVWQHIRHVDPTRAFVQDFFDEVPPGRPSTRKKI